MLTLLKCECDKFITLRSKRDKFITLTNIAKSTPRLLFAKAARRPSWRVPIRLYVRTSIRLGIKTSEHLHVCNSRRLGIHTAWRLSSIRLYFQASTRLYVCTLRRLYAHVPMLPDVYTPGCLNVRASIRLYVWMSRSFTSRCLDIYTPVCTDVYMPRSMDVRASIRMDVQMHGHLYAWMCACLSVCTCRYLNIWARGLISVYNSICLETWVSKCLHV